MTRIKKSRKLGSLGPRKADKRPEKSDSSSPKKARKGLQAGARNGQLEANKPVATESTGKKDVRVGSKKPISLLASDPSPTQAVDVVKQPQAKISKQKKAVEPTEAWQKELSQLEQDTGLQDLLDRYDNDDKLSAAELAELNKKMSRHAWLMDKLGLNETDLDEDDALFDEWESSQLKDDY